MLEVSYLPGARRDFDESLDWYADRSPLAAERFLNAIDAAVTRITEDPVAMAFLDRIHQHCPVRGFPFRIVFRQHQDQIVVVAVAHAKRRPGYWLRR